MKKIMFNDQYGLTQAVLEGRKTQTRRIIKTKSSVRLDLGKRLDDGSVMCGQLDCTRNCVRLFTDTKSTYKIGEEVAVAQSYKDAGVDPFFLLSPLGDGVNAMDSNGWDNKMFVRADLMPHRIKITNIRVERLQDISEEDCLKEGIEEYVSKLNGVSFFEFQPYSQTFGTARKAFASLIDKVSGKGTWEKNPYVFVYDFELVK